MPRAAVAGGEIYYEDTGQGEPVVFASGLNGVGRYWKPQVALFSRHFRVIEAERKYAPTRSSPVEVSVGRIDALMRFDRRAGLPAIKAQTLVMGSDGDFITPGYFSEALAQAISGAKLIMMKGGGHSFTTTRAEPFNRYLMAFLQGAEFSLSD